MKVYIDFDGTIVNSAQAICNMYNARYSGHKNFVPAKTENCNTWNMSDVCPLAYDGEVSEMFTTKEFFENLAFYDGAHDALKRLSKEHELHLVTIGTLSNIQHKAEWCRENLDDVLATWHFTGGKILTMDKSFINTFDSILIDDHISNLHSVNVPYKICACMLEGDWNEGYHGYKAYNWEDIEKAINSIAKNKIYPKTKRRKSA